MCASDRRPEIGRDDLRRTIPWLAAAMMAATLAVSPAYAADKKADPNKEQIRRLQQAQKRLEQEKSALAGELDSEKKKTEEEAQKAASLARDADALRAARDQTRSKLKDTESKVKALQDELARAKTQQAETQRQAEAEKARLEKDLAAGRKQYDACVLGDQELRKVSTTVLELYEKKTCSDGWLQNEPFTGIKRVEIENTVEDLREKLETPIPG